MALVSDDRPSRARPHALPLDPGWLFLIAGLALIGATVLVGAHENLDEVRWQRDRALALEDHRIERLKRYHAYMDALEREDPDLVLALTASELNEIPAGRIVLDAPRPPSRTLFASLEPDPLVLPDRRVNHSVLARWSASARTRPWLLATGALCLLVALLPPVRPS
jgi:hypothetical protein